MADASSEVDVFSKIPVLELAKTGLMGLACLVFLIAGIFLVVNLIRRNADAAANQMLKTYLTFGLVMFVVGAIAEVVSAQLNPHSTYQVTLQFSPDMHTNGLPDPQVRMHAQEIALNQPIRLSSDDTINVIVDPIIQAVRSYKHNADSARSAMLATQDAIAQDTHEPVVGPVAR